MGGFGPSHQEPCVWQAGRVDAKYAGLRHAAMGHTSLTSATDREARGNSAQTAMDIGSIASVIEGDEERQQPQHAVWSLDETGWQVKGLQIEGRFDAQSVNFVKVGKGKRGMGGAVLQLR